MSSLPSPPPNLAHRLRKHDPGERRRLLITAPLISLWGLEVPQLRYPNPECSWVWPGICGLLAGAGALDGALPNRKQNQHSGLLLLQTPRSAQRDPQSLGWDLRGSAREEGSGRQNRSDIGSGKTVLFVSGQTVGLEPGSLQLGLPRWLCSRLWGDPCPLSNWAY